MSIPMKVAPRGVTKHERLNISLDSGLAEAARAYAKEKKVTLSSLISDFLAQTVSGASETPKERELLLVSIVERLAKEINKPLTPKERERLGITPVFDLSEQVPEVSPVKASEVAKRIESRKVAGIEDVQRIAQLELKKAEISRARDKKASA
ncbi:DUF6364 family protein [Geminisphaera colitermitum]|uniref:DUF6364 family protein n=1 Tax=Geminisphaera colitermitum TaxID=1148786 RepID=UPI0005BA758B|nr:DUF6364 family protein [Geminisphaera colitermitum]